MKTPRVANIFSLTTKRLTDLVLEQSRQAFRETGIELDAKMTSIIMLIHQSGPQTSTELAGETGLSRQLVESRLRRLVEDDYLEEGSDASDRRKRVYSIANGRIADVNRAIRTVADLEEVYDTLWAELGTDLHKGLRDLEATLNAKPLLARLAELEGGQS
jgi:DNA-binding MarR family transcriptional regulator